MKKRPSFTEQIREVIRKSKCSRYSICKEIGIGQASMSRFMNDDAGLSMPTLDKLAELLNFKIAQSKTKKTERQSER